MLVVKSLECVGISMLRSLDELGFVPITGLALFWVGQVAFSGRTP